VFDQRNPDEFVGKTLSERYRILKPLGQGAMGSVFVGEHIVIGRQVAIKILSPRLGQSDDFGSRFRREAIAAGRLDHPNCVPVTDSGELPDGTSYMVMELVTGKSLGTIMKEEGPKLEPLRALRIVRHVLRGLRHAHKMGIVHRDIKPDNVMLEPREGAPDFARILDFGIAKLRDADNKESQALTQAGMAVGTPTYLSPEQAMGDEVDHRCDLYSAAIMLFEMLTGRPPYTAKNPVGILTKHASAPIPALNDVDPAFDKESTLNALVQKGLAKLRNERFGDADEFIKAIDSEMAKLGAVLTPAPPASPATTTSETQDTELPIVDATGDTETVQAEKPSKTRGKLKKRLAIGGGIVALAIAGFIFAPSSGGNERLLKDYQEHLENAETCEERLQAVRGLRLLGDKRAIPILKKARRRMRGGVLGLGQKNTNRCLKKEAEAAIKEIQGS
jgi:serine/threonine protein kinase